MGQLLDALRADAEVGEAANSAKLANLHPGESKDSQIRSIRSEIESEIAPPPPDRTRLLAVAADELLPADLVHRLDDADMAACAGLDGPALRTYLRVLDRDDGMARGIVPEGWEAVAHCDACGPIHWRAAEHLKGCAWCKHRRALRAIPRPPVRCGDCAHYVPDPLNPTAGMGRCSALDGQGYWPGKHHRCPTMRPRGSNHDPAA